jgi:flagellar biosynthetic protein FliQ
MTDAMLMEMMTGGMKIMIMILAPLLLSMLVVGLGVSLFQAVTQVNEPTLVFIPKFAISFVVLLIAGPWMADQLLQFTTQMLTMLPAMAR